MYFFLLLMQSVYLYFLRLLYWLAHIEMLPISRNNMLFRGKFHRSVQNLFKDILPEICRKNRPSGTYKVGAHLQMLKIRRQIFRQILKCPDQIMVTQKRTKKVSSYSVIISIYFFSEFFFLRRFFIWLLTHDHDHILYMS